MSFAAKRKKKKKKKKKALTESKTNKYLTLSYKNYLQKAWPPPLRGIDNNFLFVCVTGNFGVRKV